jgi:hypothetical protein
MDLKSSAVLGGSIIVASLILAVTFSPKALDVQPGRFQVGGVPGHAYILDTATGEIWESFANPNQGSDTANFRSPKLKVKQ